MSKKTILLLATLNVDVEMELVEAACEAVGESPHFRLRLRNHPLRRVDAHPAFTRYRDRVGSTTKTLEEDLAEADLVLFTYSTTAEQAFLGGTR